MDFEQLYCELTNSGKDFELKKGKVFFNGEYNGKKFVRYIYQKKDTLELDVYVCIDKPYGQEQTKEDRSESARERNRWIRDEFNQWGLSHKFPEWRPEPKQTTPGGSLPQIKSSTAPQSPIKPAQASTTKADDFDWNFVDQPAKDDDNFDPFADTK